MFKFSCKNSIYFYDPIIGYFFDSEMNQINLLDKIESLPFTRNALVSSTVHSEEYIKEHTYIINNTNIQQTRKPIFSKVRILDITLGSNCNYKCKYCIQDSKIKDLNFNEDSFFEKIKKSSLNFNNIENIRIWGGEPFVYWKRFKKLIIFLREKLKYSNKIITVTNGSLFNLEICNFCLKYNVNIMFSHDGPAQTKLRNNIDYLNDINIRSAILKFLKESNKNNSGYRSGIITILGPYNKNIKELLNYLEKKLYVGFPIKLSTVLKLDSKNKELFNAYGENGLEELKQELLWGLRLNQNSKYYKYFTDLYRLRNTVVRHLIYAKPYASFKARCPAYNSVERLSIDCEGNLLTCYADVPGSKHNHGNIEDESSCYWDLKSIHERDICRNCPYVAACMGGCPLLNDEDHLIRCQSMMPYNQAIFESAFEILFHDQIIKIEEIK